MVQSEVVLHPKNRTDFKSGKIINGFDWLSEAEAGQMPSAETGLMSAVETSQMFLAESAQMWAVETRHRRLGG